MENLSDVYILIFAGLVSALDNLVGETVRALRESRLYDNTVIFFSSDVSLFITSLWLTPTYK